MKDYFTPVEFKDEVEEVAEETKQEVFPEKEKFTDAISTIKKEFSKISEGTSKYSHYAITMKDDRGPATATLERFEETPNRENMDSFLEIAEQEFGLRVKRFFEETLNKVLEDNND